MLSKLLCAKRRKSHNSTKYCESIIKSAGIKQMAIQHHRYDQHLSQFWKHLVTYFRTGRPIQTNNSNCIGGGRTTQKKIVPVVLRRRYVAVRAWSNYLTRGEAKRRIGRESAQCSLDCHSRWQANRVTGQGITGSGR